MGGLRRFIVYPLLNDDSRTHLSFQDPCLFTRGSFYDLVRLGLVFTIVVVNWL